MIIIFSQVIFKSNLIENSDDVNSLILNYETSSLEEFYGFGFHYNNINFIILKLFIVLFLEFKGLESTNIDIRIGNWERLTTCNF